LTGINSEGQLIGKKARDVSSQNDLLREMIGNLIEEQHSNERKRDVSAVLNVVCDRKMNYYKRETIEITAESNEAGHGVLIGYLIILKNITQFEEEDLAKNNFIANVSHELKTPISSINLILKLLEDDRVGTLSDEQKKLVQSIRVQANRLSRITNELMEFSRFESGGIQLKLAPINPEEIIAYAVDAVSMLLKEKEIALETQIAPGLPQVLADTEKSVWVLVNIIGNAIRYSPLRGEIVISAARSDHGVKFSVKDQGPGIAEENQKKIFDKFVRIGNQSSKGWGVGLAMSKEFVESQGGAIWVESELGQGSRFSFTLPSSKTQSIAS
jgi:signal transduction histidine kinase